MVGWLETAVQSLEPLPQEVIAALSRIGELDAISRNKALELQKAESDLLYEVHMSIKDSNTIDPEDIKRRADALVQQRRDLVASMDLQLNVGNDMYSKLDQCINNLDSNVKSLNEKFASGIKSGTGPSRRNPAVEKFVINLNTDDGAVDQSSEPLYCHCRRVQFGKMVGCESMDCTIEWFHFGCVGLTEEPDVWYCPTCRERLKIDAAGNPLPPSVAA